jgi:hypothetical protein
VVALADGGWGVIWLHPEAGTPASGSDFALFVQRFAADGTEAGAVQRLAANGPSIHSNGAFQIEANGETTGFAVAWIDASNAVFVRRFDMAGQPLDAGDIRLDDGAAVFGRLDPSVVQLDDGTLVAAWTEVNNGERDAVMRRFAADGTPLTPETNIHASAAGNQEDLSSPASATAASRIAVGATDGSGLSVEKTFTVAVGDVSGRIEGTPGDDALLLGTGEEDVILGLDGDDRLDGGAGPDTLIGGARRHLPRRRRVGPRRGRDGEGADTVQTELAVYSLGGPALGGEPFRHLHGTRSAPPGQRGRQRHRRGRRQRRPDRRGGPRQLCRRGGRGHG